MFEIKNNYNNTSEFSRRNSTIIDQRDIVNIDGLIKEWIHNYDSFFRIPFELYKNSHNINNSFEDRFRCIITSLDSLFDRITPNKLKNIEPVHIWKDIEKKIKKCIPEESPLLERVHNLNRVSLSDKISMLSEHFTELYESKIESEIRNAIPIRNWISHGYRSSAFDNKLNVDDDFVNFNVADSGLGLGKKIYILQKIFEFSVLIKLGMDKEILVEKINSDHIISQLNEVPSEN